MILTPTIIIYQETGDYDQDQTSSQDAIVELNFSDVYTFGNGVESYKIKDRLAAKKFFN